MMSLPNILTLSRIVALPLLGFLLWWPTWQLGYAFAFTNRNFPAAAAMSIILLVITLAIGIVIVFRSGLFGEKEERR